MILILDTIYNWFIILEFLQYSLTAQINFVQKLRTRRRYQKSEATGGKRIRKLIQIVKRFRDRHRDLIADQKTGIKSAKDDRSKTPGEIQNASRLQIKIHNDRWPAIQHQTQTVNRRILTILNQFQQHL